MHMESSQKGEVQRLLMHDDLDFLKTNNKCVTE